LRFDIGPRRWESQRLADAVGSFSPPSGQQRGVQAFTTKKSADTTACRSGGLGFFEDALLIFRVENHCACAWLG